MNDRLIELPNELILLILSSLPAKEVIRSSIISKKWRRWLLGYYPKLNFQGPKDIVYNWLEIRDSGAEVTKEKSGFVKMVDGVMNQHLDLSIDELRVVFDLDTSYQSVINRWVDFALTKRVKTLKLDFKPILNDRLGLRQNRGGLNIDSFSSVKRSLRSLSLYSVNITSEVVDRILVSCPFLENLQIEESELLTSIKFSTTVSPSLKRLDVSNCNQLKTIDISAEKMTFFRYVGQPIKLNIQSAVSLSSLFIGGSAGEEITYAFEPLSMYFSQLEVLYLRIPLDFLFEPGLNLGIEHLQLPLLSRLKVLNLYIIGDHTSSLLGWAPLLDACPVLETLIVKFACYDCGVDYCFNIRKRSGSPLKRLKTFEMYRYCGRCIDIEFAKFVFENATNIERLVVETEKKPHRDLPIRIDMLKDIVPQNVNFILF